MFKLARLLPAAALSLPLMFLPAVSSASGGLTRHDLVVTLRPAEHNLSARDTMTLSGALAGEAVPGEKGEELRFVLHKGLGPSSPTKGVEVSPEGVPVPGVPFAESYRIKLPPGLRTFVLEYGGSIRHPVEDYGSQYARGFSETPGTIEGEGVYLAESSFWYPVFEEGGFLAFTLEVKLPAGWDAVSQGARTAHSRGPEATTARWECLKPQEEIYLVASRFTEYDRPAGAATAMAFLREPDQGLAARYLDATAGYMSMYDGLIGPYPYAKFALVENFWETGFGMPSFTLLGPTVIRLPFILHSSYPHEILHNWWGNGVYPEYEKGNWSEGLTAYLSDHLIKEQGGEAARYRQETLQKYADYVSGGRDFPLTKFRARHSPATEAVGYGKSLMFFHMLRLKLGDEAFIKGLRDFYGGFRFRLASFDDIRRSLEKASGEDLGRQFEQWVSRTGAPKLKVKEAKVKADGNGYALEARIEQTQPGEAYVLRVPVAVTMEGREDAYQSVVEMSGKSAGLRLRLPARPVRLDVDPEFDVFRRLDMEETPPALTQAFGAVIALVILPSSADKGLLEAYRALAGAWAEAGAEVETRLDSEVKGLPSDRAVVILGWENLHMQSVLSALSGYDVKITGEEVRMAGAAVPRHGHSFVLSARNPENRAFPLTWVATDTPGALAGLGRKLPHYHKYSYLAFEGQAPENVAKGRWPVINSPMTVFLPGEGGKTEKAAMGRLAPREPLARRPAVLSGQRMAEAIKYLSSPALEGRGAGSRGLELAARYIAGKFREAGLKPAGDIEGSYFQEFEANGPDGEVRQKNVIGVIPGKRSEWAGQSVVLGAHYDHLGFGWPDQRRGDEGKLHPGADDNASGVAVLLELARALAGGPPPERSIVFAAFAAEEGGREGSRHYMANARRYPAKKAIAMVNLDTVGRLEGGRLLVLGASSAPEWVHIIRGAGYVTGVPVEAVAAELDSSDQVSFEEAGVPAVQFFTGPNLDYHRPTDTAEKIDIEGLVRVGSVAREVIDYLAGRQEAMSPAAAPVAATDNAGRKTGRKVSLGTVPDFAFKGAGCRIAAVVPGSPAEDCGLAGGDVIVAVNGRSVATLRDLSDILKSLSPGDRVSITFIRRGAEMSAEAVVEAR